ncbi:MAG: NB-ARC domain-containing protein, partial [Ilumatobacteraceae bacterium]
MSHHACTCDGWRYPVAVSGDAPTLYGLEQLHTLAAHDQATQLAAADAIAEIVRDPDSLPPLRSRLVRSPAIPPLPRHFVGRDELLAGLLTELDGSGRGLTQTMSGLGGVGKTTIAAAFAEAASAQVDIVWWVRAEDPISLMTDLAALGDRCGIVGDDDIARRAVQVRDYLTDTDRRWVLVFDNAVDEPSIFEWVPRRGTGITLVTTRNQNFDRIGAVVEVGVLAKEVATEFLSRRVAERNQAAATDTARIEEVAHELQGLPLALEQAGAWVAGSTLRSFGEYLDLLRDVRDNPFPDGTVPLGYERTMWETIQISVDASERDSAGAGEVWQLLGWFASEAIPIAWLAEGGAPLVEKAAELRRLRQAVEALATYSLVRVRPSEDGGEVDVHRVVQAAGRRASAPASADRGLDVLEVQNGGDRLHPDAWPTLLRLRPHAQAYAEHVRSGIADRVPRLWRVLNGTATATQLSGGVHAAVPMFETNLDLVESALGDR